MQYTIKVQSIEEFFGGCRIARFSTSDGIILTVDARGNGVLSGFIELRWFPSDRQPNLKIGDEFTVEIKPVGAN